MSGIGSQTAKSAKTLAVAIAKQAAREPLEILKNAGSQVTGKETPRSLEQPSFNPQNSGDQARINAHQGELQDKIKSGRRMEALNRELEEIHKQEVFKDLQKRISQGEEVPLEDYGELSMEQKQVLKAQMEAVKFQKQQVKYQESQAGGALFGSSKKGRKMGGGQKKEAEKQQTRVEKPVPPSG